jgi:hypothetical protein
VWANRIGSFFSFVNPLRDLHAALQFTTGYFYTVDAELRRTLAGKGVQLTRALGRGAWGVSFSPVLRAARKG